MPQGWEAPSEDDLATQQSDYPVLAEDEYIAVIREIGIKPDVRNNFPTKGDMDPTHDMISVKAELLTFANGDDLVDVNDEELEGPVFTQPLLNPKKIGMIPQPSKTRKFFAAVLGQPVGDPIKVGDFAELIGKQLIISVKPKDGYNNAVDFRPIRRSRSRGTTSKGPVDGGELINRAKEIFDEDSPTNTSPNPVATDDLDF